MYQDETKEKLKSDKLLLKLHLKYILGISLACICLVIILSFCEDSTFKNCISVSSTVTSIILSVIAIILSVTGERTTNEIRNKVSDSVSQLEICTDQSSKLSENLSITLEQLEGLYKNMNDNIVRQFPIIQTSLDAIYAEISDTTRGDYVSIFDAFDPKTNQYIQEAYQLFIKGVDSANGVTINEWIKHLVEKGIPKDMAFFAIGIVLGNISKDKINFDNQK